MENKFIKNIPAGLKKTLKVIGKLADSLEIPVFAVGGFVRDILLKKKNLDLDIVVEADAINFSRHLSKLIPGKLIIHQQFGTATIAKKDFSLDLATARKETYNYPAALPVVCPGTIRDDLFRRDFTVNAIAFSLNASSFGELSDFFGGLKDLKQKKIRVLHELSFIDDPTRILRAIRFKGRLGFKLEDKTSSLMDEAIKLGMLLRVKPPRIFDELIHILKEDAPKKHILSISRICGLDFIDPRININSAAIKFLSRAEKEIRWFEVAFSKKRKLDSWLIYFIILLDGIDLPAIHGIIKRFNLKKGDAKRVISYKDFKKTNRILSRKDLSSSAIFKTLEPLSYEVILLIKIKSGSSLVKKRIAAFLKALNGLRLEIKGEDLRNLGLIPGKNFRLLLDKALHKKIEGKLKNKKAELEFIKQIA